MGQPWPTAGAEVSIGIAPSFKWVIGHPNFAACANFSNELWNEGLVTIWNEIYGDMIDCNANRVCVAEPISGAP